MDSTQISRFSLFITVFSCILAFSFGDNSSSTDAHWLLRIKSKLVDPAGVLESWSLRAHICSWNGLTCSHDEAFVIALNLSAATLSGSIPTELWNLVSLQTLDLSLNLITGSIPPEIGRLRNLRTLILFANNLSGKIPTEIGLLKKLQVLRIGDNMLAAQIPPSIGNLTELRVLGLAYCQLNGSIPAEMILVLLFFFPF
ncbi:hypothetical protein GOBAR_DD24618 [Gossypium barbadense]|nr:hypothetical protein GOBAR_DD24618 [Gossypium barbadense]